MERQCQSYDHAKVVQLDSNDDEIYLDVWCRRYPPTFVVSQRSGTSTRPGNIYSQTAWPRVKADDRCGEYKEKGAEPPPSIQEMLEGIFRR